MRMTFTVKYDNGTEVEAVAKPKDIVAFERQYNASMADFADEDKMPPMEWLYFLAWSPLHRQGREPRAFDAFLDDVDEITPVEDEVADAVPPTPPAPSDGTSPGSP